MSHKLSSACHSVFVWMWEEKVGLFSHSGINMDSGQSALNTLYTFLLSVMLFFAPGGMAIANPPAARISGHLPPLEAQSMFLGRVDSHQVLTLALTLPFRNEVEMNQLIGQMYDSKDSIYHHFLSPAQFRSLFCPAQVSYDSVKTWADSNGLKVVGTHRNRTMLDVEGTVGAIEQAFDLHINTYLAPDGRVFRSPDQDPATPPVPVSGVIGLDNLIVMHPYNIQRGAGAINPDGLKPYGNGTGPGGGLAPADIKRAYNLNGISQNGSGQTLGLFELDGYKASDISQYESYFHLNSAPLHNVFIDKFKGSPGKGAGEVTLDIELMTAIADGASKILVYEGPNTGKGVLDTYQRIANDDQAQQVSTSWGLAENLEGPLFAKFQNKIFAQMLLQGQALYAASGDSGAFGNGKTLSVDEPASDPYVVGVGGTTLATNGSGGSWKSETTWRGSGGGISSFWIIPFYQKGFISSASRGSRTRRNVPDVSLNADPNTGYAIFFSGGWTIFGGTSAAAPLWAAFNSLVDQARVALHKSVLGFPNPSLYSVANSPGYSSDFHDIKTGNNLYYPAVTRYDDATGLGTFNGANLLLALTQPVNKIINITSSVKFTYGAFYNRLGSSTFVQRITITNISGTKLTGPFKLVISGLTPGVTLLYPVGTTVNFNAGSPYVTVGGGSLNAGAKITVFLSFNDPSLMNITYTPVLLAGSGTP